MLKRKRVKKLTSRLRYAQAGIKQEEVKQKSHGNSNKEILKTFIRKVQKK